MAQAMKRTEHVTKRWLVVGACLITGILGGAVKAHARDTEPLMGAEVLRLSDADLAAQSGGFVDASGLLIRFGIDIVTKVNGEITRNLHMVFDGGTRPLVKEPTIPVPQVTAPSFSAVKEAVKTPGDLGEAISEAIPTASVGPTSSPAPVSTASSVSHDPVPYNAPTPTVASAPLEMMKEVLNTANVVVNERSNVTIQQVSRITVDVANFRALEKSAFESRISASSADLVKSKLLLGLGGP